MKFLSAFLVMMVLGYLLSFTGVWWMAVVSCFVVGALWGMNGWRSFSAGTLALFSLWGISSFWIYQHGGHIMADRIGVLFQGLSGITLVMITAILGGLAGGLGCLSGAELRRIWR